MTKYYRVRSQEQWEWLKNKLEIEDDLDVLNFPVTILYGDVICGIYGYHDDPEPLIEVSQLMEDEKMENEDYVTIKGEDLEKIKNDKGFPIAREAFDYNKNYGGYSISGAGYIQSLSFPKSLLYPKVRMSVAEKKEFDELKKEVDHASEALSTVRITDFGESDLARKIYRKHELSELDFARAWADPSLIEVVKEPKFNVKVPVSKGRDYYEKYSTVKEDNLVIVGTLNSLRELSTNTEFKFTASELKEYGLDDNMYEKVEVKE